MQLMPGWDVSFWAHADAIGMLLEAKPLKQPCRMALSSRMDELPCRLAL